MGKQGVHQFQFCLQMIQRLEHLETPCCIIEMVPKINSVNVWIARHIITLNPLRKKLSSTLVRPKSAHCLQLKFMVNNRSNLPQPWVIGSVLCVSLATSGVLAWFPLSTPHRVMTSSGRWGNQVHKWLFTGGYNGKAIRTEIPISPPSTK